MPNDIDVLCAHAGIDHRAYRSFPRTLRTQQEENTSGSQDGGLRMIPNPSHFGGAEQHSISRIGQPGEWRVLRSIFEERSSLSAAQGGHDPASRALPPGSLTLIPGAGGVGVTTLVATIARILAVRRQSVLIVDGAAPSMLPFHFGGTSEVTGRCSFLTPRGSDEGAVSVLACGAEGSKAEAHQIWQDVRESGGRADHILMDLWSHVDPPAQEVLRGEGACLVVLTPDVHSAVRLRQIEKSSCAGPLMRAPYYVLNRFDQSLSLHNEFHRFFSNQLGERLLRTTIRRSDEVAYALAEGTTVADYAPNSAVTGDFHRVADWLQALEPANPKMSTGSLEI